MFKVPDHQVQLTAMRPTESAMDDACWGLGRSAPSGLTASRGLVGASNTFSYQDDDESPSAEDQAAVISAALAQTAWMLDGRAAVYKENGADSPAAIVQTAGQIEALDLATRRLPPVVNGKRIPGNSL